MSAKSLHLVSAEAHRIVSEWQQAECKLNWSARRLAALRVLLNFTG